MNNEELVERLDEIRYVCEDADALELLHKLRDEVNDG